MKTFNVGVSRMATGKTGYETNKYDFGNSFKTEAHTIQSLYHLLAGAGYPITMVHNPAAPGQEALKRNPTLTTYRHLENFISLQVIGLDDDSAAPGVVDGWLSDEFTQQYGAFLYQTSSSRPEAEKCRVMFVLDHPITDPVLAKEIMLAFHYRYPRIDRLSDVTRVWYGAENTAGHIFGNMLPMAIVEDVILSPYRAHKAELQAKFDAEYEQMRRASEAERKRIVAAGGDANDAYAHSIDRSLEGIFNKVAAGAKGTNRHSLILWAGATIGKMKAAPWAAPHYNRFSDIEARIMAAAAANGYEAEYGDALRTFNDGLNAGALTPAPEPIIGNHRANGTIGPRAVTIATENAGARTDAPDLAGADLDAPDLLPYPAADEGNAQAFLLLYGGDYLHTKELGWLTYNGKCWTNKGGEESLNRAIVDALLRRRLQAVAADNEPIVKAAKPSAANVRNCKYMLESILWASITDFDTDPDLLNCDNGVVDLRTGKIAPHDHTQRFTYCIDTPYNPQADDAPWANWIYETVTPTGANDDGRYAELCAWIQMAVGYSLTGRTNEQCLFYLQGPTRAGKGVFIQTLIRLLGRPLSSSISFNTLTIKREGDNQNFDLAPLKPCRLLAASESERNNLLSAAITKLLTGDDPITAAFKHKTSFNYMPLFKIWLSSNFMVMANADDDALWGRLRIINFPNTHLGQEDFCLKDRLWGHRNGILKWAIDGAMAWYERKNKNSGLGRPAIITETVKTHRYENDTVSQFIEDCCNTGPDFFTPGSLVTLAYTNWCKENNLHPLGGRRLGAALRSKGLELKNIRMKDGQQKKSWLGLKVVE